MSNRNIAAYSDGVMCARRLIGKLSEKSLFEPESAYMVFGYCACVTGLMMAPADRVQTIPLIYRAVGLEVPRKMKAAAAHPTSGTAGHYCNGFFTQLATHFWNNEQYLKNHGPIAEKKA